MHACGRRGRVALARATPSSQTYATLKAVAAGGALALAGCSGELSNLQSAPPNRGDRVTDYELVYSRNTDGEPVFYASEQTTEDDC